MKWRGSPLCVDLNESKLNVREDSDNLFEIVPKLSLEPLVDETEHEGGGDFVQKEVRVIPVATVGSEAHFAVAMNSDLLVLNSALDHVQHQMEFDATIDFVLWRRSILLIGLSSSKIHLMNPNTYQIVETRHICTLETPVERFFVDAFIHANPDPTKIDLVVMGLNGTIYSFIDVGLSAGSLDFTMDENLSIDIDLATIKGTALTCLPPGVEVLTACSPVRGYMLTGDKANSLSMFSFMSEDPSKYFSSAAISDIIECPNPNVSIKKIDRYGGLLALLLSNGRLEFFRDEEIFFSIGRLKLPSPKHVVQDFQLVIMNADVIKLWVLFSNMEENDHFIGIAAGPRFELEFLVRIPSVAEDGVETSFKFPACSSALEEPNIFIELGVDGSTKVYRMEEFSTDISLRNLLLKGKFDKAELLANRYAKDMDLVWKAKVAAKYAQLLASKTEAEMDGLFGEVTTILTFIKDSQFVCSFVVESGIRKLNWVNELMEIGMKRVGECSGSSVGKKLLNTVKKFYTFQQVVPEGSIERWNEFNSENTSMFLQCREFLQRLQFKECEIIWLRHCDEFLPEVELPSFVPFFKKLFWHRLDSEPGVSLLKTIFPFALEKCECDGAEESDSRVAALISLVTNQIQILEREVKWPNEGIEFLSILLAIVEEEDVKLQEQNEMNESRHLERAHICQDILERLRTILQALKELKQLYSLHKIRISFEKYLRESKLEVINLMLAAIWGKEEVEYLIKDFLIPFAERNALNFDEILEQHIDMIANEVAYYMHAQSIPFEERMLALVEFIQSPLIRLGCIQRVAKAWPVPWHPPMEEIVKRACRMNVQGDPIATDLQKNIHRIHVQVPYRCLLQKYNLSTSKLTHGYNVMHTIKRILKSQKEGCYEDCLELIKHTGKCDVDGVRKIKFWQELSLTSKPIEEILEGDFSVDLLHRFLNRLLEQFRQGPDLYNRESEPWERYTECARTLANRVDHQKAIQFFQLRQILSNLWSTEIVESRDYPFSALQIMLEEKQDEPGSVIIRLCHRLSQISFMHVKDILVTAGSFFCQETLRGSGLEKIWEFVAEIVRLPGNFHTQGDIVPYAGLRIAHRLALIIPTTSTNQLDMLQEFYKLLLGSYGTVVVEPVVKLMAILSMFRELREKEIPLENELLSIYTEVWREGRKGVPSLLTELRSLGESLLRFGDTDLFAQIFVAISKEYFNQSTNTIGPMRQGLRDAGTQVNELRLNLLENKQDCEIQEKNVRVMNLVKALQAIGLSLNAYALRQRNKARLIQKLVDMNQYLLASQTALVFDFRDGPSWSMILREYICQGTIAELKSLLEALKKISELWVVPEFKEAWIKVSEKYPNFRHICPIPLAN